MHICFQNLDSTEINETYKLTSKSPQFYPRHFFSFRELHILVRYVNCILS